MTRCAGRYRTQVTYGHPRSQHGRSARALLARHRDGFRRISGSRSSRSRTRYTAVRTGARTPARTWAASWSEAISRGRRRAKEFNTIAVDDGIAMGHGGMLYSLPSPRADRRLGRVHGQRTPRRRARLHLQLRQDHPGHAAWPRCA